MASFAIEINDAAVTVVGPAGVVMREPGYVLLDENTIAIGDEAYAQAQLKPRRVHNRYWSDLSLSPVPRPTSDAHSNADLAFRQLEHIWDRLQVAADDVLLVVSASYDRQQLGVLLGIAQEAELPVTGIVDAAVASSRTPYPDWQLIHVDTSLHQIFVTQLSQTQAGVERGGLEVLQRTGLVALRDAWVRRIAEAFVANTRFDPFHQAETEQALYDQLPDWLSSVPEAEELQLAIEYGGQTHSVKLTRQQLLATSESVFRAMTQLISTCRLPGASLVVLLSSRLSELPGVDAALARLTDTHVVKLAPGAAAANALQHLDTIRSEDEVVTLTTRLPWLEAPAPARVSKATAAAPAKARTPDEDEDLQATHVVYAGIAHQVGQQPLDIGQDLRSGDRGIRLESDSSGVSRRHCSLVRRGDTLVLADHSRYGTFVNEKKVDGEIVLEAGDVIRIGTPGVELTVIAISKRYG